MAEEERRELVPEALADQRIDRVVALVADISRRQASGLVEGGQVEIDGVVAAKPSQRVTADQEVSFRFEREQTELVPDPAVALEVVFADDQVIVVDKQAGMVVHPGSGVGEGTLVHGLLARFPELASVGESHRPGIVHRLDRGTSGLLVVARTDHAYHHLVDQLRRREVERRYLAVVHGRVEAAEGLIDAPLGRSPHHAVQRAVVAGGQEARTRYRVLGRSEADPAVGPVTGLECRLETGRTHQIRVHLAAIDHPVVGDVDYGGRVATVDGVSPHRPFLHAARLGFQHPTGESLVRFGSPLPALLATVADGLDLGVPFREWGEAEDAG